MKFKFATLFLVSVCFSLSLCDDNNTTTTTEIPTTTTTTTITPTTTTTSTTSTTTSTPKSSTTTTVPSTTTPSKKDDDVLSFRVPKNESEPACLKAKMSLEIMLNYVAEYNNVKTNETVKVVLDNSTDFNGLCENESFNQLTLSFKNDWQLTFNYTLVKQAYYELNSIQLKYTTDKNLFPNASSDEIGTFTVAATNMSEFSANKGNSYKCFSKSVINLSNKVFLDISNYQAQPFLTPKNQEFDTAVECAADTNGTSKLVPIIVGSALAILVILVLIAYVIGRRKHRPGYQQV